MAFRVKRAELLESVGRVMPGLSARDFIEQSKCFAFDAGWCSTFNDEITCATKTPLPAEFTGVVRANELVDVLSNLPDEDVTVDWGAGRFWVRGNRVKCWVRMEPEILLPLDTVSRPEKGGWVDLPEDFHAAVEAVTPAAGSNNEEFITSCIHMHPDYMEACNRKQAVRFDIRTGVSRPFVVRAASLKHVVPLGLTRMGETDDWVHFRNKHVVFSCRRHLEDYPTDNITDALGFRGHPATLPRGAQPAARLAGVFSRNSDEKEDRVRVVMSAGKMLVVGEGAFGGAEIELETSYRGPEIAFRLPPKMLEQVVKDHTQCEIGDGKLRADGEKWVFMTVLGATAPEPVGVPAGGDDDQRGDDVADGEDGED